MKLYSVKTEGDSQYIYSFFTDHGFNYVTIHTVEDYAKAGLAGAFLEKLKRLAHDDWDYCIQMDCNPKFIEAVCQAAEALDKTLKRVPNIQTAHTLLQHLYFRALADNEEHEAFVDPMDIEDLESMLGKPWEELLADMKKDVAHFKLENDVDLCNDEFQLVVKRTVLPKFKVPYKGDKE